MFKKLNDHLVSFIEAQWILCNILNARCKQSCRAFLQEFQGFLLSWEDAQHVIDEREVLQSLVMPPLEAFQLVTCVLKAIPALCLQQTLALWVIVAWLRLLLLQTEKNTFMQHFWQGLKPTWYFSSGIGLDLALGWCQWTSLILVEEENLTSVLISSDLSSA